MKERPSLSQAFRHQVRHEVLGVNATCAIPKSERLERVKKDQTYNLFLYKKPQISYQFDRENVTDFRQSDGSASLSSLTRVKTSQSLVLKSVLKSSITLPCYQFFYIISTNRVPANIADKNDKKNDMHDFPVHYCSQERNGSPQRSSIVRQCKRTSL